jgi:hypothetical protein
MDTKNACEYSKYRIEEIKTSLLKHLNKGKLKADGFHYINIVFRQNSDNWLW